MRHSVASAKAAQAFFGQQVQSGPQVHASPQVQFPAQTEHVASDAAALGQHVHSASSHLQSGPHLQLRGRADGVSGGRATRLRAAPPRRLTRPCRRGTS
jgi:hypothetical protein